MMEGAATRVEAAFERALEHHRHGRFEAATAAYDAVLALRADHVGALYNRGNALRSLGRHAAAVSSYDAAIACRPELAGAHYNRGNALRDLGMHQAAIASYDRALAAEPGFVRAHYNRGNAWRDLGDLAAALADYEAAVAIDPDFAPGHLGRGECLAARNDAAAAVASFAAAIALDPHDPAAYLHAGDALQQIGAFEAAGTAYQEAIALQPQDAAAYGNLGNSLSARKRFAEAVSCYDRALALAPGLTGLHGARLFAKLQICDWRGLGTAVARLAAELRRGTAAANPFCLLCASASPALQRQAAAAWVRAVCPADRHDAGMPRPAPAGRIRVGYFSADFRNHPVARLTAGLFETHDRSRFEIIGFASGPAVRDAMRVRLEQAFDRFIDVHSLSDADVVSLARQLGLQIAVDLGGFTEYNRPNLFALRVAPVQVSYLGYLGTTALPAMDYVIAAPGMIPRAARRHFSEKVIELPSYQANDSQRRAADGGADRRRFGLPAAGFVFCCFNANHKLTPATFGGWMRILARVPDSVLFLGVDAAAAADNLRGAARRHGIAAERLVCAGRVPFGEYLARYGAADLFLDTLPYNAGATASDALWAGLPVLTRPGRTFAGRVAASLLTAIGLPELVATTQARYEDLAVGLATDPPRLEALRAKLAANRATAPLFDTRAFTAGLESAYVRIAQRDRAALPPAHLRIRSAPPCAAGGALHAPQG